MIKYTLLLLILLFSIFSCRPAQYAKQGHLDKSIFQIAEHNVLVMDLETNIYNGTKDDFTNVLFAHLNSCSKANVLTSEQFYNQYQFGFVGADQLEEQLELLKEFTDIDYLVIPFAIIESKDIGFLSRDESRAFRGYKENAATAGIEVFNVKEERVVKYVKYSGAVNNEYVERLLPGEDFEWELYPSGQKIVKNCYEKSLGSFLRYTSCGKNRILQ